MSEQMEQVGLPPGWDCKYDSRTGRYYYVNLFTKTTQWEDPRARIRQLQTGAPLHISNDSISMQPVHGSPYHVYPASNSFYPAQAAFQNPPSGVPSLNASPNLAQRLQQQQQQQHIEMSPMVRSSPRMGLGRQGMVETTFTTNVTAAETDLTVAKINSMFPTVPETHIRMLLKKYMKSIFPKAEETLILDVLANADNNVQTASQQLLKMGYDKREQPVPQRSSASRKGTGTSQATEDDKKEELKTPTPKLKSPEEKKKIKARLQTKYKDTPEKIILMALESVDYSEERAKKILNIVIQEDRDKKKSVKIETPHKAEEDKENARASAGPSRSNSTASSQPRTPLLAKRAHDGSGVAVAPSQDPGKTTVDGTVKATEQQQEGAAAEASTTIAASLEADHSPGASTTESSSSDTTPDDSSSPDSSPATKLRDGDGVRSVGKQNRPKAKTDHAKTSSSEDESSEQQQMGTDGKLDGKSPQLASRIPTKGPNMKLFKGPNDDLLLTDYVTWNGANPDLAKGSQKKSTGPDRAIRTERTYKPHGPNAELCKGPVGSLAKGSMYTQLMKDVKCN
ncbi:muscle M-line assembly protein unc-89 isoform X5 [Anopheles gambiae]|uniref:muscle M-line assembly protein unc-89 isoform X5 n=1 Tax=Anopheles gambiae TaxID=7165 RepID=UPI002AC9D5AB|nr:muscle M-line assembly protein unc-89 isoform X5 [Anopheles gambiae]